jgi:hypothetical protein
MKRDSLVVKNVSLPQPDIDDYHIVMIPPSVNSVKNLPGSRIEKMSILTSVFETNKSSDVPLHVPFGSPIPPTPTGTPIPNIDSDVGSVSEHSIVQVKNSSDTSLAYSDWNGDHRWETYRIRPVEVLQVRDVSPLRVSFDS